MATDKQIQANRRNAIKSTGPKTEEGKQASKGNAWKHCLAAKNMLYSPMRHEDHNAFHEMRSELMQSWHPVGLKEEQIVDMIASAYNRMQRLEKIESGYMDGALATMQRRFGLPDTPTSEDDFGCGVAMGDENNQLTFETLDRYRKNAWLDYDRAIRRLEAMQKARREQAMEEKEEELREAERQKKIAEIRAASTAKPVVYATEHTTSEELASFRKNNPNVTFVPFGSDFRRTRTGKLTAEIVPIHKETARSQPEVLKTNLSRPETAERPSARTGELCPNRHGNLRYRGHVRTVRAAPGITAALLITALSAAQSARAAEPPPDLARKVVQRETATEAERAHYTYRQTVTVAELPERGQNGGEYREVREVIFSPSGERTEQMVGRPTNTLRRLQMTPEDFADVRDIQPMMLTEDRMSLYQFTPKGEENIDNINCWVLQVRPRQILAGMRLFEGVVWADQRDFSIIRSEGRAVPQIYSTRSEHENLFPSFTTVRTKVGNYWFPVLTEGVDTLAFRTGPIRMKLSIRYRDYKRFGAESVIRPGDPVPAPSETPGPNTSKDQPPEHPR